MGAADGGGAAGHASSAASTGGALRYLWAGPALVLSFAALSLAIWSGVLSATDHRLLLAFRVPGNPGTPLGPAWLAETERDITGLGSNSVMVFIAITAAGLLVLLRAWRSVWTMLAAGLSAQILCAALKIVAQRPRPNLFPDVPRVFTTSFPSSHSMVSAATLFTLAAVVARLAPRPAIGRYAFAMAACTTAMIGLSRIYLGVHWPSDVVAGWTAGLICAWGCGVWLWRPQWRPGKDETRRPSA